MARLTFGWHAPPFPLDGSTAGRFVEQVDAMLAHVEGRFEAAWFDDHLIPWAPFQPPETPNLESLTTLAWFAARHPDLRFGTSVLCQSFRNPGLVAKMAANLQLLTGGRLLLGLGAGWLEDEFHQYGYDFPSGAVRIAQLEEAVQVIRRLWTGSPASFHGEHYRIEGAYGEPRPDPPPPILIGGGGERLTLRVVARWADWWNIPGGRPEVYEHKLRVLADHCDAVGRDFGDITKTWSPEVVAVAETRDEARAIADASPYTDDYPLVGIPDDVVEQLTPFVELGVEHLVLRFVDFPSTAGADLFAREVAPRLRELAGDRSAIVADPGGAARPAAGADR